MDDGSITRITLPVKDATAENTAKYGQLLGAGSDAPLNVSDFYKGAVATSKPVDFVSDDDTVLSLATIQPRPFEITYMERHFKHTQTFIPLGGKPFYAVFGPPSDDDMPDFDKLEAFRFDGTAGFCMYLKTWHEFPFAEEPDTNVIVILRGDTTKQLAATNVVNNEAQGDDLDKKNIIQRANTVIALDI